jgi:hypothetical protein
LSDLAGYLVLILMLYPSIMDPLGSFLLILHLCIHVHITTTDLFDDHLIDEGIENLEDALALGAEFLLLLFQEISSKVDQEHLEA